MESYRLKNSWKEGLKMSKSKMTSWVMSLVAVVLMVGLLLPACAPSAEKGEEVVIKVGQLQALTGPSATECGPISMAVMDSFRLLNERREIFSDLPLGGTVKLLTEDHRWDTALEVQLVHKQVESDQCVTIVSCTTAGAYNCKDYLTEMRVPYLTQSSPECIIPMDTGYTFLYLYSYPQASIAELEWALDKWEKEGKTGKPTVALFGMDTSFARQMAMTVKKYCEENGIEIVATVWNGGAPIEVATQVRTCKEAGADIVFGGQLGGPLVIISKEMAIQGYKPWQVLSHPCLNDTTLFKTAGQDEIGWATFQGHYQWEDTDVPGIRKWIALAKEWHPLNTKPEVTLGPMYIHGAVSGMIAAKAIYNTVMKHGWQGVTRDTVKEGYESIKNFTGLGGEFAPISYGPGQHIAMNSVAIYQVLPSGDRMGPVTEFIPCPPWNKDWEDPEYWKW